jgi:hypothetical protein
MGVAHFRLRSGDFRQGRFAFIATFPVLYHRPHIWTPTSPRLCALRWLAASALFPCGVLIEIQFDASEGRASYQTLRAEWMVGQQFERTEHLNEFETIVDQASKARYREDGTVAASTQACTQHSVAQPTA